MVVDWILVLDYIQAALAKIGIASAGTKASDRTPHEQVQHFKCEDQRVLLSMFLRGGCSGRGML
jgi:hypothetical protein